MIEIESHGDWSKTSKWFNKVLRRSYKDQLAKYGEMGVANLSANTPKDTGLTSRSWGYEITEDEDSVTITWTNSNMARERISIALLIQHGHATRSGTFVQGRDYINPSLAPVFDAISKKAWEEVNS